MHEALFLPRKYEQLVVAGSGVCKIILLPGDLLAVNNCCEGDLLLLLLHGIAVRELSTPQ